MTPRRIELLPAAEQEARDAHRWYAERDEATAERFIQALDAVMARIADNAERWPEYLHGTRRLATRGFPFTVIYRVQPVTALVVAIAHQRRKPGFWRTRATGT